jgi:hypothetical protein
MSRRYEGKLASVEKTTARAMAYRYVKREGYLYGKYHIVIASVECGDIHLLRELGLAGKIIACDVDPKAKEAASRIPGVILSPFADIVETTRWAIGKRYDIGSINLDLCSSVVYGAPMLKSILDLAPCPVIYTYCRREGKLGPKILGYTIPLHPAKVQHLRAKYLRKQVGRKPVSTEPYESDTNKDKGSHMVVSIFAAPPKRSIAAIRKNGHAECMATMKKYRQIKRNNSSRLVF